MGSRTSKVAAGPAPVAVAQGEHRQARAQPSTLPLPTFRRVGVDGDEDETWPGPSLRLRVDGVPACYGVSIVGSSEWTGKWNAKAGWKLYYHHSQGTGWQTRIPLELFKSDEDMSMSSIEFKFALTVGPSGMLEQGENRKLSEKLITAINEVKDNECVGLRLKWESPEFEEIELINPISRGKSAVVVLGKRLFPDGRPTSDLVCRLKKAASVHRRFQAEQEDMSEEQVHDVPLIVTGGPTVPDGHVESMVMKRLLVDLGVPVDLVVEEPLAMTTVDNVVYVYELIEAMGIDHFVVVTAAYHLDRARALFLYMRNLGPPYRLTISFEGHTTPISVEELAQEHDVESRVMRGLGHHLAHYVPEFFSFVGFEPRPHPPARE